jgi:hypothetical protein
MSLMGMKQGSSFCSKCKDMLRDKAGLEPALSFLCSEGLVTWGATGRIALA